MLCRHGCPNARNSKSRKLHPPQGQKSGFLEASNSAEGAAKTVVRSCVSAEDSLCARRRRRRAARRAARQKRFACFLPNAGDSGRKKGGSFERKKRGSFSFECWRLGGPALLDPRFCRDFSTLELCPRCAGAPKVSPGGPKATCRVTNRAENTTSEYWGIY